MPERRHYKSERGARSMTPPPMAVDTAATEFLTKRVGGLARLLERRTARMLWDEFRLTLAEWRILAQLSAHSPSTVRDLSIELSVDRAEASRAAASLIARGYVARADHPTDRRSA